MESSLPTIGAGAAILGVLSHQRYFVHGEWDRHALTLLYCFIVGPLALTLFLTVSASLASVLRLWLVLWASYTGGLLVSIAVYRTVFHSLCQFPGPFAARATSFWSFRSSVVQLKWHTRVQSLHETYGDFVRISMLPTALYTSRRELIDSTMAQNHAKSRSMTLLQLETSIRPRPSAVKARFTTSTTPIGLCRWLGTSGFTQTGGVYGIVDLEPKVSGNTTLWISVCSCRRLVLIH